MTQCESLNLKQTQGVTVKQQDSFINVFDNNSHSCCNSPMYVCLCKAVTDKDIHRAVNDGATTMRCLRQLNGVGSQCGRCVGHAKEVLAEVTVALDANATGAQANNDAPNTSSALRGTQKEPVTIATGTGSGVCYP